MAEFATSIITRIQDLIGSTTAGPNWSFGSNIGVTMALPSNMQHMEVLFAIFMIFIQSYY